MVSYKEDFTTGTCVPVDTSGLFYKLESPVMKSLHVSNVQQKEAPARHKETVPYYRKFEKHQRNI